MGTQYPSHLLHKHKQDVSVETTEDEQERGGDRRPDDATNVGEGVEAFGDLRGGGGDNDGCYYHDTERGLLVVLG